MIRADTPTDPTARAVHTSWQITAGLSLAALLDRTGLWDWASNLLEWPATQMQTGAAIGVATLLSMCRSWIARRLPDKITDAIEEVAVDEWAWLTVDEVPDIEDGD